MKKHGLIFSTYFILLASGLILLSCMNGSKGNPKDADRNGMFVVKEEGRGKKINMAPLSRMAITAHRDSLVASGTIRREDLFMELKDELTAVLTIRPFSYYDDNKGFNRFIDSSFQVIRDHDTKLKHTGYRLQSARGTFATAVIGFPMDKGILPEHPVRPSVDEVIMNQDAVLEYTLDLIKQNNAI